MTGPLQGIATEGNKIDCLGVTGFCELAVLQSSPHAQQKKRPAGSHRLSREESRDPEYVKLNVNSGLFGAEADSETDVIIMEENLTHG